MGIDYVIDLPCQPKDALGVDVLVNLVKARNRASTVLAMVRDSGDQRSPDQISFTSVLETPDGAEEQEVTVQALLDEAAALEPLRAHCSSCPANGGAWGFGCYRSISYPVPEEVETWLIGRLPDDLDSTAGQFLTRAVADFGWDGAHAAELRAQGDTFFEADDALAARWGEPDAGAADDDDEADGFELDTDQIFQMLFHVGHISPAHATMLALFFGVLPHDVDVEILRDDEVRRQALAAATLPAQGSPEVEAMAMFLRTLAQAAQLDVDVLVDG